jgi:hypothetical protein
VDEQADLKSAWEASEVGFADWVVGVADAYERTDMSLEAASTLVSVNPAEFEAVLHLATMDEDDLRFIAEDVPPKSTWFLLAGATSQGVREALAALKESDGRPSFEVVEAALREAQGPSEEDRVAALPPEIFKHLAAKADQYKALNPGARRALASFGTRLKGGRPLTPRQLAWATDLLEALADARVVARDSPDDDVEICNLVLDAIGR